MGDRLDNWGVIAISPPQETWQSLPSLSSILEPPSAPSAANRLNHIKSGWLLDASHIKSKSTALH